MKKFLLLLVLLCGCTTQPEKPVCPPKPAWRVEEDCPECKGTGKVNYDGSVPWFPKGTYTCPMCGGCGKLDLEIRK